MTQSYDITWTGDDPIASGWGGVRVGDKKAYDLLNPRALKYSPVD